jgi:hypothetical protein
MLPLKAKLPLIVEVMDEADVIDPASVIDTVDVAVMEELVAIVPVDRMDIVGVTFEIVPIPENDPFRANAPLMTALTADIPEIDPEIDPDIVTAELLILDVAPNDPISLTALLMETMKADPDPYVDLPYVRDPYRESLLISPASDIERDSLTDTSDVDPISPLIVNEPTIVPDSVAEVLIAPVIANLPTIVADIEDVPLIDEIIFIFTATFVFVTVEDEAIDPTSLNCPDKEAVIFDVAVMLDTKAKLPLITEVNELAVLIDPDTENVADPIADMDEDPVMEDVTPIVIADVTFENVPIEAIDPEIPNSPEMFADMRDDPLILDDMTKLPLIVPDMLDVVVIDPDLGMNTLAEADSVALVESVPISASDIAV